MSNFRLHLKFAWLAAMGCGNGQRIPADPPTLRASPHPAPAVPSEIPSASPAQDAPPPAESAAWTPGPQGAPKPRAADGEERNRTIPGANTQSASGNDGVDGARVDPVPPLRDAAGKPLPQTDALPSFDSPSFKRRMALLFDAIVADDPQIATPAFFPVLAYEQVKAISQPARDHKLRLLAAFAKNIHEYHLRLGKAVAQSKLLDVVPSTLRPRWMMPGTEGNRLGYHRLLQTRLKVADGNGKEHVFEITSMISWRGEWYVVHLHGFK